MHQFWTAWWKVHIFLFYLQLVCTKIMRENYLKWVYCEVSSWVPLLLWLTLKFNAKLYCQFRELSVIFWQVLLSDWWCRCSGITAGVSSSMSLWATHAVLCLWQTAPQQTQTQGTVLDRFIADIFVTMLLYGGGGAITGFKMCCCNWQLVKTMWKKVADKFVRSLLVSTRKMACG